MLPNKLVTVIGDILYKDIKNLETYKNVNNILKVDSYKFQFMNNIDRDIFTLLLQK